MAGMKYRHCSKVCETCRGIIKHLSIYKVRWEIACCIVLYNTLYKTNDFSIAKTKAMLLLAKPISEEKSPYTNALDKRDLADIDKEIPNKNKVIEMLKVKVITPKS